MNLIEEAFIRLFPNREFTYLTDLEYNRRLGNFNANISLRQGRLKVNLNLQWKDIDPEIKIGLIQNLLLKILKVKSNTPNIDLYNNFIKNIPLLTPKVKSDPLLEVSFHRVNSKFIDNQVEKPNLNWGTASFRKLASYNFHNDTVTVSTIFRDAKLEVLDYLMYHELLHKQFKFSHKNGRSSFHHKKFRDAETAYPNQKEIEKEIESIIKNQRRTQKRGLWKFFN